MLLGLFALGLAASGAKAADLGLGFHRPHRHHRHARGFRGSVVPLGYAYGGYGNGPGPGYEASGYGPGYGPGYAPGYGYIPPGLPTYGLDLGY